MLQFRDDSRPVPKRKQQQERKIHSYQSIQDVDLVLPTALEGAFNTRLIYRQPAIKLAMKILTKATDEPENEKFRSLKAAVIERKYANAPAFMALLRLVGFYKKDEKLILDTDRIEIAKHVLKNLKLKSDELERMYQQERERIVKRNQKKLSGLRSEEEKKKSVVRAKGDYFKVNKEPKKATESKAKPVTFGKKDITVKFAKSK